MSSSLYAVSASEEEDRQLTKKEREAKAAKKAAWLKDREDLKKWTPILFIVPFGWAIKCVITIVMGSLITNLDTQWRCTQPFRQFISGQIVFAYWFMLMYTWMYIGPYPIKRLKHAAIALILYSVAQFGYAIYGTVIFNIGFTACRDSAPNMWAHTRFEIGTYWLAFSCLSAYLLRHYYEKHEKKSKEREVSRLSTSKTTDENVVEASPTSTGNMAKGSDEESGSGDENSEES